MSTMQARFRTIAIAAILVAAAVAGALYFMKRTPVHAPVAPPAALARLVPAKTPQIVPAVAFEGVDGRFHALSEWKGRYVLLNLWAVWCAPCVKELPALARLKAAVPKDGIEIVAVDVARGTAQEAQAFLNSRNAAALGAYIDPQLTLMRAFGAYGLPMTVLIDPKGREIARAMGPADWDSPDAIAWFKALGERKGA
jgi:thiol-disulfide isomerase/thioredoxin